MSENKKLSPERQEVFDKLDALTKQYTKDCAEVVKGRDIDKHGISAVLVMFTNMEDLVPVKDDNGNMGMGVKNAHSGSFLCLQDQEYLFHEDTVIEHSAKLMRGLYEMLACAMFDIVNRDPQRLADFPDSGSLN